MAIVFSGKICDCSKKGLNSGVNPDRETDTGFLTEFSHSRFGGGLRSVSAGFNYLINIHSRRITMQNMLTNNTCIEAKRWNEKALAIGTDIQRAPSFSTLIFHDFSLTKKK